MRTEVPGLSTRVTVDTTAVDAALRRLAADFPRQGARALNTTARRAHTRTRREIAANMGIPQRLIRNRVAWYRASARKLRAWVWVGLGKAIKLETAPGAFASLSGDELRVGTLRVRTFRARMPNGYTGLFVRKANSTHRERPDGQRTELPIESPRLRIKPATARIIAVSETAEQMRTFLPGELRRLIRLASKRR